MCASTASPDLGGTERSSMVTGGPNLVVSRVMPRLPGLGKAVWFCGEGIGRGQGHLIPNEIVMKVGIRVADIPAHSREQEAQKGPKIVRAETESKEGVTEYK